MEPIEDKILRYSELEPEERRALERRVAQHPELEPLLEEAKGFDALLQEAAELHARPPSDEALAYYVASRHFAHRTPPPALREAFAEIEQQLAASPDLQERYHTLAGRLRALTRESDSVSQFERLTGHRISGAEAAPPAPAEVPARIYPSGRRLGRWAAAAVLALAVLYGLLLLAARAAESDLDRLAALDPEELSVEGYRFRVRGEVPPAAPLSPDEGYLQALDLLQEARHSVLGLFTWYDEAALAEAAALLEGVVEAEREQPTSFLRLEAAYLLGKLRLRAGDLEGARSALHTVVENQGRRAPEAARILAALEEMEP